MIVLLVVSAAIGSVGGVVVALVGFTISGVFLAPLLIAISAGMAALIVAVCAPLVLRAQPAEG
jgi:hypothetical protein